MWCHAEGCDRIDHEPRRMKLARAAIEVVIKLSGKMFAKKNIPAPGRDVHLDTNAARAGRAIPIRT
jgi:hypothetical protein